MAATHVLLFFHLLGALCLFGGGAVVGVLQWRSAATAGARRGARDISRSGSLAILALMVWRPG